jgi:hypothetical protein
MLYRYTGATPIAFQFSETRSGMLMPGVEIEIDRILVNASAFDRLRAERKLVPARTKATVAARLARMGVTTEVNSQIAAPPVVEAKKPVRVKKESVSVPETKHQEVLVRSVRRPDVTEELHSTDTGFIQEAQSLVAEPEFVPLEVDKRVEQEPETDELSEVGKVGEVQIDDVKPEETLADDSPPVARRSRVQRRIL